MEQSKNTRGMNTLGPLGWLGGAAVVVALVVGGVWLFGGFEEDVTEPAPPPVAVVDPLLEEEGIHPVEEITQEPAQWEGQRLTIAGNLSAGLITDGLAVAALESFDDPAERMVLVSAERPLGVFPEVARARTTGTVTQFDVAEIEAELDVDDGLYEEYEGTAALLVDELHFFVGGPAVGTTVLDIMGWPVTATADVTAIHSDRLFMIAGDADTGGVLVYDARAGVGELEGELVEVTGVASVFQREEVDDEIWGELSDGQLEDFEGLPLIIAEEAEQIERAGAVD